MVGVQLEDYSLSSPWCGVTSKKQYEAFRQNSNKPFEEVPSCRSSQVPPWISLPEDKSILNYSISLVLQTSHLH